MHARCDMFFHIYLNYVVGRFCQSSNSPGTETSVGVLSGGAPRFNGRLQGVISGDQKSLGVLGSVFAPNAELLFRETERIGLLGGDHSYTLVDENALKEGDL